MNKQEVLDKVDELIENMKSQIKEELENNFDFHKEIYEQAMRIGILILGKEKLSSKERILEKVNDFIEKVSYEIINCSISLIGDEENE